jgi:UDP-2-acetamido-3-amino-2,3-dideoxy-glucuronate N-acetyltransferase
MNATNPINAMNTINPSNPKTDLPYLGVLHTACNSDPGIVAERKKGFPGLHFTTSLDEILKNPDIKAVAISTPAGTHYEMVKQSLLEGKNVFVEKCQG